MNLNSFLSGIFLLVAMTTAYAAPVQNINKIELLGGNEQVELRMETRVGLVSNVKLGAEQRSLLIAFKGADVAYLNAKINGWKSRHPMIQGASVQAYGETVQLVVDFNGTVSLLNESVVALGQGWSRLEVVLGRVDKAQGVALLDADKSTPQLTDISVTRKGKMVELALAGNTALVAEVSFDDQPPAFVVDLPGVDAAQAQQRVDELGMGGLPGLIKRMWINERPGSVTRLRVEMTEPADLVHSSGVLRQEHSVLRMQLVADSRVISSRPQKVMLQNIGAEHKRGRLELLLKGAEGAKVNVYALEQPSRLMVDFLGWGPDQVIEAVSRFTKEHNPAVAAVRYGESRLGSARVEFELPTGVQVADTIIRQEVDEKSENVIVALDAPGLSQVLAGVTISDMERLSGLDLRYSPAHNFTVEPTMMILPLNLADSDKWAAAAVNRPAEGKVFDLLSLYTSALEQDAKYQSAKAEFRANSEAVPQARAGYLPTATFDFTNSVTQQDVQQAANPSFPTGDTKYDAKNLSLTITQPLIKFPVLVKIQQAHISVEQARINLLAAEQDLIMRVAEEYLKLLAAKDALELAQAERDATLKQLELARTNLTSGLGTITELYDAEGRYALIQTKEIVALNEYDMARLKLKEIVGEDVSGVRGFQSDFTAVAPQPAIVGAWIEAALAQNLALQSRNLASQISKLEIERQTASRYPTLELVGSLGRNDTGGSLFGDGQESDTAQIMIQLHAPLYSGGMVSSRVRESVARWEQSEYQKDEEYRRTESLSRAAFIGVLTSSESLDALRKMVKAQESALAGRLDGFQAGMYDIVDVLDGYRLYYAARRDYLKTRYTYLVNRLKLKQAIGTLSRNDLEDLAAMLEQKVAQVEVVGEQSGTL